MKIAFIGLGNMGAPMAANLVKAGFDVCGFDLGAAAMDNARALGVAGAGSSVEAARDADCVITMLPAGKHVLSVYAQDGGVLASASKGALFVDCSTIDVGDARKAHAIANAAGHQSLDAPVSGGVAGAQAGSLTFMAGGEATAFSKASSVLAAMGARSVHCGPAGAGQAAKICNNMILGVSMAAVCEGIVLAEKLGLSHKALFDVVSTSSGSCWSITKNCPMPGLVEASASNNDFKPGFAAELMLKDLTLAAAAARNSGARCELGEHARTLYEDYCKQGNGGMDFSAIVQALRNAAQ